MLKRAIGNKAIQRALRSVQGALFEAGATIRRELSFRSHWSCAANAQSAVLVNVGCGELTRKGWVNLDAGPPNKARYYYNAINPLPFADGSVEHIHAEHFLEHLDYFDACRFISDSFRVLGLGGSLRIIVPDLEKYIHAYYQNDRDFFDKLRDLGGSAAPLTTRAMVCNQMFRMGTAHKFAWDFETLTAALRAAGFGVIERSERDAVAPKYQIDGQDWWREFESLYVNVWK